MSRPMPDEEFNAAKAIMNPLTTYMHCKVVDE